MDKFSVFLEGDEDLLIQGMEKGRSRDAKLLPILVYADYLQEKGQHLEACLLRIMSYGRFHHYESLSNGDNIDIYADNMNAHAAYVPKEQRKLDAYTVGIRAGKKFSVSYSSVNFYNSQKYTKLTRDQIPQQAMQEMQIVTERCLTELSHSFPSGKSVKRFKGQMLYSKMLGVYDDGTNKYKVYRAYDRNPNQPNRANNYLRLEPEKGGSPSFIEDRTGDWVKNNLKIED